MKLWKPIVGFVMHKKVLSSVIGIAMVGSVSAAAVAANNGAFTNPAVSSSTISSSMSVEAVAVQLESSETSSTASSAISSSASEASTASSTVSGKPSSVASSAPSTPSRPSAPNNTATRSKAIADENTRHSNALAAISSKYDSQITAMQNEISAFQSEGARDTSAEIEAEKSKLDQQLAQVQKLKNEAEYINSDMQHDYELTQNTYNENCNIFTSTTLPKLTKLGQDYTKLKADLSNLPDLKTQKQNAISNESNLYANNLAYINSIYP